MKTSSEIREAFLKYFEDRGHKRVKSSSLVPENDPTLLFTNAGMNQFKHVFLGLEKRDYKRAASSQKCMRVSGKHNDLEMVGRTARHHTFFEMLGNFSFGDYFKKLAIEYAWELCTDVYKFSPERLYVTVYQKDDEALALWRDHIAVPEERIFRMGKESNFWAMGDTGPCGPCSELHYDMLTSPVGHVDCSPECDCGRYVEIWNLVFMQFNRDASDEMTPLPSPSIDTGMGLERVTCVLQGVHTNYDTDLFRPIIEEASRLTGVTYGKEEKKDISLRILADHSRACAFLINDGVVPGNEGRGYVLRKILRRAIRQGKMLGTENSFIYTLTALVAELLKDAYPELEASRDYAAKIVKHEEEKFSVTLSHGIQLLDEICEKTLKKGERVLPGQDLFRLYDTYGFPLDLAREIATERKLDIDDAGFDAELEKQRERARASWKGGQKTVKPIYQELATQGLETEFTGYTQIMDVPGRVLAIIREHQLVSELAQGQTGEVLLDRTPFYAEAGGQVGDRGTLENETTRTSVKDVYRPVTGLHLHKVKMDKGRLKIGDTVYSNVFCLERANTVRNHTATHLLHAALREVLGEHVKQAGSLVAQDRLRFDFAHYKSLSTREIREIEELVNEKIRKNMEVQTEIRNLDEAIQEGAMALFGEKYQERVRVVKIPGFSMELCGGTHVNRTGDIALFKIISESSISAGVRRLEAMTGQRALSRFIEDEALLGQLSENLRVQRNELASAVKKIARELKDANRQIDQLQLKLAQEESGDVSEQAREIKGVRVLSKEVENLDRNALRQLADRLKNQLKTGVVVLGTPADGKATLVVMVTRDLTDRISASDLIRKIAPLVDGGGGGKADMAEAGGKDPSQLSEALEQTYRFVAELLS
ncbi:alanine--tRNA ligase [Acidobacteria bacterium AH-259-A15]|nr:alanine--tRNA ligase [Acidobacteria bacterium AH-259-A15]